MQAESGGLKRKLCLNETKWSLKVAGCSSEGLTWERQAVLLEIHCLLTFDCLNVILAFVKDKYMFHGCTSEKAALKT